MISKEKQEILQKRMEKLQIKEDDLEEKFVLSSGKGGQNVNKNSTCVFLKHIPSQLFVKCQKERSLALNRYYARKLLCEKMEEQLEAGESAKQREIEKIRNQKKRRSRKTQKKLIEQKRQTSEKKQLRKEPFSLDN